MSDPTRLPFPPGTEWCRADRTALVDSLRELETHGQQVLAMQGAILAEMQSRGVPQTYGYSSLEALLKDTVRCSRYDAQKRTRRALACNDYSEGTQRIAASAPATAGAFAAGEINTAHVDSILKTLAEVPGAVPEEERAGFEESLVGLARDSDPAALNKAGRHLLELLEQDYLKPDPPLPVHPERELRWSWSRDRTLRFTGKLDPVAGAIFEKLLSPLAKPLPAENGELDTRPVEERQGDALAELLDHTQRVIDLPTEAGERPAVIVTMTLNDLQGTSGDSSTGNCGHQCQDNRRDDTGASSGTGPGSGVGPSGETDTGTGTTGTATREADTAVGATGSGGDAAGAADAVGTGGSAGVFGRQPARRQSPLLNGEIPITAAEARLLACDARIIPAVLGSRSEILDLGHETRTASKAQRRALLLRDRGCIFPSCTRPANWTQAHHGKEWAADDGPTDLDNLVLLCTTYHRLIHASEWSIRMADDGKPDCIPPTWLDPTQTPRRNRTFAPFPLGIH